MVHAAHFFPCVFIQTCSLTALLLFLKNNHPGIFTFSLGAGSGRFGVWEHFSLYCNYVAEYCIKLKVSLTN
jgi:hypothetical protein